MLGVFVVLDRVRRAADAVGPPVGEIAPVYRRVLKRRADGGVELLEADHAHGNLLPVALPVGLDDLEDLRLRGRVVTEHAGHGGDDEVVGVSVFLAQGEIPLQIFMEGLHRIGGRCPGDFAS